MPDRSCLRLITPACCAAAAEHDVNGADADGYAQQVTHELDNAEIRTPAHQRQRDDHLAQPSLGDRISNRTSSSVAAERKASSSAQRALSVCW